MTDNNAADRVTYLLIGAGLGAALALLFAPKSGRELREDIADASRKTYRRGSDGAHVAREKLTEGVGSAREKITDGAGAVREKLEKTKGNIASAIDAGKQAYREERNK
jgi:gas vesicle protein